MNTPHWKRDKGPKNSKTTRWRLVQEDGNCWPFPAIRSLAVLWQVKHKGGCRWIYNIGGGQESLADNLKPAEAKAAVMALWRMR